MRKPSQRIVRTRCVVQLYSNSWRDNALAKWSGAGAGARTMRSRRTECLGPDSGTGPRAIDDGGAHRREVLNPRRRWVREKHRGAREKRVACLSVSEGQRRDNDQSKQLRQAHRKSSSGRASRSGCVVGHWSRQEIMPAIAPCSVLKRRPVTTRWTAHLGVRVRIASIVPSGHGRSAAIPRHRRAGPSRTAIAQAGHRARPPARGKRVCLLRQSGRPPSPGCGRISAPLPIGAQ
jgi:hypothetical protein